MVTLHKAKYSSNCMYDQRSKMRWSESIQIYYVKLVFHNLSQWPRRQDSKLCRRRNVLLRTNQYNIDRAKHKAQQSRKKSYREILVQRLQKVHQQNKTLILHIYNLCYTMYHLSSVTKGANRFASQHSIQKTSRCAANRNVTNIRVRVTLLHVSRSPVHICAWQRMLCSVRCICCVLWRSFKFESICIRPVCNVNGQLWATHPPARVHRADRIDSVHRAQNPTTLIHVEFHDTRGSAALLRACTASKCLCPMFSSSFLFPLTLH